MARDEIAVLVVDDEERMRSFLCTELGHMGFGPEEASTGESAIERARERDFHVVLLDLRMPGLDGVGIVEVLRTWGHDTPILMISGFGTVDAAVDALHAGADDFETQPTGDAGGRIACGVIKAR